MRVELEQKVDRVARCVELRPQGADLVRQLHWCEPPLHAPPVQEQHLQVLVEEVHACDEEQELEPVDERDLVLVPPRPWVLPVDAPAGAVQL